MKLWLQIVAVHFVVAFFSFSVWNYRNDRTKCYPYPKRFLLIKSTIIIVDSGTAVCSIGKYPLLIWHLMFDSRCW